MQKLKIVYLGTPDFSVPTLELLLNHPNVHLHSVITMPDRPVGRGQHLSSPAIAEFARQNGIRLIQTANINKEIELLEELAKQQIDAIIVLACAQFLGSRVLKLPRLGCFNIHTSLLPKYRGAAPIQHALLNGDDVTGVSIQKMVKEMDAGDIVLSHSIDIEPNETGGQLHTRLKFQAALSTNELIKKLMSNKIESTQQDQTKISFAPCLKKEDGLIDFKRKTVSEIHNQVRALLPWPGTYCYIDKKRLKIFEIAEDKTFVSPGELSIEFNSLLVGCLDGTIRLLTVQIEGKKSCCDVEFINGLKDRKIVINPDL